MKYSFIVPVYNCDKYLNSCIDSILAQKVKTFEIVLIDDGSPDKSGDICDAYEEKYNNIRVYHKENGGASSARNLGIDNACGEYLIFIDGDDTIDENMLEELDRSISDDTAMAVYGMSFDYYRDENLVRTDIMAYPLDGVLTVNEAGLKMKDLFEANSLSSACNKVFVKKIIDEAGLRFNCDMTLYEDFDFVVRYLGLISGKIVFDKEGYYHYRLNEVNHRFIDRISDFNNINKNLEYLGNSLMALNSKNDSFEYSKELYLSLYINLLSAGLIHSKKTKKAVDEVLNIYRGNQRLQKLMINASYEESSFVKTLKNDNSISLTIWTIKKKVVSKLRKLAKGILVKLGIK